jgi:hypothetical protein
MKAQNRKAGAAMASTKSPPKDEFAEEIAGLADTRIEEETADENQSAVDVVQVDDKGKKVEPETEEAKEPIRLYSQEEFRALVRPIFDAPQHIPTDTPIVGPMFGPDWAPFAINDPMKEAGFNATCDHVYAWLLKRMPNMLRERDNAGVAMLYFGGSTVAALFTIYHTRKLAAEEAAKKPIEAEALAHGG